MLEVDNKQPYIIKLPGLYKPEECELLIAKIDLMYRKVDTLNANDAAAV